MRIVVIVLVVLALIAAGVYGYARITRALPLHSISIEGADHLTDDEKSALAQIPADSTVLDVDTAAIKANFLMDAWVKDVSVNVVLPDSLVVNVTEREIGAIVEMKSADGSSVTNWALSTDGVWLMPIPDRDSEAGQRTSSRIYEDADAAIHILNVPYSTNPQIGVICSDSNVNNAVEILNGMTTELADQVKNVSATDAESTTLLLQNGVEIAFGTATDIRAKERVCLELLSEHEGEIAYINVRTVSRPTWRTL